MITSHVVAHKGLPRKRFNSQEFEVKIVAVAILLGLIATTSANAGGWSSIHRYVKRSGKCGGQEILASFYSLSGRTSSGERFVASGNTAAARTWPIGTTLTVTNPANGQSVVVRINDRGPWGRAYQMGVRLDLARGAAKRIGMRSSQYVCVS
jgi:rare lipoprotein A